MTTLDVLNEVREERIRQDAKWGEQNHPDFDQVLMTRKGGCSAERMAEEYEVPTAPRAKVMCKVKEKDGTLTYADILVEEVAEVVDAFADKAALRKELLQVAAVAVAWVEKLDREAQRTPAESSPS